MKIVNFFQLFHWLDTILHEQFLDKEKPGLWSTFSPELIPLTPSFFFGRRLWRSVVHSASLAWQRFETTPPITCNWWQTDSNGRYTMRTRKASFYSSSLYTPLFQLPDSDWMKEENSALVVSTLLHQFEENDKWPGHKDSGLTKSDPQSIWATGVAGADSSTRSTCI